MSVQVVHLMEDVAHVVQLAKISMVFLTFVVLDIIVAVILTRVTAQ
jgi:hypothetical protein